MTYYMFVTNTSELSRDILEAALRGLTHERSKIEEQIQEIEGLLHGTAPAKASAPAAASSSGGASTKKRTMSADARKRIAEAQRKRWAVSKGEEAASPKKAGTASKKATKKGPKARRVMSPEVRARMAEAQRKRWAAKKQ